MEIYCLIAELLNCLIALEENKKHCQFRLIVELFNCTSMMSKY